MNSYKIDLSGYTGKVRELVSEAVQKKAFELGYGWFSNRSEIKLTDMSWLIFDGEGNISWNDRDSMAGGINLISVDDFLSLTTSEDAPEFKPFDKVLVRDTVADEWKPDIFFMKDQKDARFPYLCARGHYAQCIPYEGNEHRVGTTE
jgi:hypothetical protein